MGPEKGPSFVVKEVHVCRSNSSTPYGTKLKEVCVCLNRLDLFDRYEYDIGELERYDNEVHMLILCKNQKALFNERNTRKVVNAIQKDNDGVLCSK